MATRYPSATCSSWLSGEISVCDKSCAAECFNVGFAQVGAVPYIPPLTHLLNDPPTRRHMETLLALQPHGPHVLVGYGPFSCMLASAIACELEHHSGGAAGNAALLLVDGAPTTPTGLAEPLPPPHAYGLFSLLLEVGALPALQGLWQTFLQDYSTALSEARGLGWPSASSAPEAALRAVAGRRRPVGGAAAATWDDAVEDAARACHLAAHLIGGYVTPEYVFQGAEGKI